MDGTLHRDGDVYMITIERVFAHPIDAVWSALTSSDDLAQWIGPGTLQPGLGGPVRIRIGDGDPDQHLVQSEISAWDPPHTLEFAWGAKAWVSGPVRFELSPEGGSTRLVFTHRHPLDGRDPIQSTIAAWDYILRRFERLLDGAPLPFDLDRMGRIRTGYEAEMNAVFGPEGGSR